LKYRVFEKKHEKVFVELILTMYYN